MNAERCRLLLKTLDAGSISAAAKLENYTPSGISKALSLLEEEAGFSLLVRSRDGVMATPECKRLLPYMRELAATIEKLDQTAAGIRGLDIGRINVGSSYNIYYRWMTEKIAEFFRNHPGISVRAYTEVSSRLRDAMNNHEIDACIMSRREGNFDWIHLKWDQLMVLVPRKHRFVARGQFPLRSLESEPYIDIYPGSETDNSLMLQRNHIRPHIRYTCADGEAAVPIVEAGLGVCIVNQLIADGLQGKIVALPIYPQQLVDVGIAIPSGSSPSPIIKEFTEYLVAHADEVV